MPDGLRVDYKAERREHLVRGASGGLVWLSFVLFVIAAVIWGGLWLWQRQMAASLQELDAEEKRVAQEEESPQIVETKNTVLRISTLAERMSSHLLASKFFDLIEELSHPRMQFVSLGSSLRSGELTLRGEAASLGVLAESLQNWLRQEGVNLASLPEIGRRENKVSFRAELGIKPDSFTP